MADDEIDKEIQESEEQVEEWKEDKKHFSKLYEDGKDLEEIYDDEHKINWECLKDKFSYLLNNLGSDEPDRIRKALNEQEFSDDDMWLAHFQLCDERIADLSKDIVKFRKDKVNNKLRLQVIQMKGGMKLQ